MTAKVLIIGGGVIGLSIARELHRTGVRNITILEKGIAGREASWAAAGMLGPQAEANGPDEFFDFCSKSRDLYPAFAAELLDETGIDIQLDRSGTLYVAFDEDEVVELRQRYNWQQKAGLSVEVVSSGEARKAEPLISPEVREALYFPNDWQVENRRLVLALLRYVKLNAIDLMENTAVERLLIEQGRVIGAETKGGLFIAEQTVVATGAWTSLIQTDPVTLPFSVMPIRGQMIEYRTFGRQIKRVLSSRRGYLVPRADGRILSGSTTEDVGFDNSVTDTGISSLRAVAKQIAPALEGLKIAESWSGLRPCSPDLNPVLGSADGLEGLLFATAHYRNGILLAPMTANIIAERIVAGGSNNLRQIFGPHRFGPMGAIAAK